jgi:hypothetical protein
LLLEYLSQTTRFQSIFGAFCILWCTYDTFCSLSWTSTRACWNNQGFCEFRHFLGGASAFGNYRGKNFGILLIAQANLCNDTFARNVTLIRFV